MGQACFKGGVTISNLYLAPLFEKPFLVRPFKVNNRMVLCTTTLLKGLGKGMQIAPFFTLIKFFTA